MMSANHRAEFTRFTRYAISGVVSNATVFLLFLALIYLGLPALLASGLCYAAGVALSYLVNRRWTFASQGSHRTDIPRYVLAYGVGLGITMLSMAVLLLMLGPIPAQIITIGVSAVSIYLTLKLLRFGAAKNGLSE